MKYVSLIQLQFVPYGEGGQYGLQAQNKHAVSFVELGVYTNNRMNGPVESGCPFTSASIFCKECGQSIPRHQISMPGFGGSHPSQNRGRTGHPLFVVAQRQATC